MNLPEHNPESPDTLKVIVLDDDRLSSHNHSIQLKFVGETPLITTSDNWQHMFSLLAERGELDDVLAIALGGIKGDMRGESVLNLLLQLHVNYPRLPVLLFNELDSAELQRLPETLKPILLPLGDRVLNYQALLAALKTARQLTGRSRNELPSHIISPSGAALFRSLSGNSVVIQRVRHLVQQVAKRPVTVLVIGEPGSGKEVVARNLHYHAGRMGKPFLVLSCASIPPERFGIELFGIDRDHPGAGQNMPGILEKADGGTLFIDEVSDLPLPIQAMLLRFLEDGSYIRVGGYESRAADVRVVMATRHNLFEKVGKGQFREDLYYRINVMPIDVPPLRDRPDDIPDLIKEVISSLENKGYSSVRFNSLALQSLQHHPWPGNVRELANLVERLGIMMPNEVVGLHNLPAMYQHEPPPLESAAELQEISVTLQQEPVPEPEMTSPAAPVLQDVREVEQAVGQEVERELAMGVGDEDVPVENIFDENTPAAATLAAVDDRAAEAIAEPGVLPPAAFEQVTTSGVPQPPVAGMVPMNEQRLQQYLENLEKNLLEVALADSAGFLEFASDRLRMDMTALREKLQRYGILNA